MDQFLSRAGHASVVLLEVIAFVWIGKKALELATRTRFREELMVKDNPAAGVALSGFYVALFLALSGLLSGEPGPLAVDLKVTALHGAVAILAIAVSSFAWSPIVDLNLREDLLARRNLGAGIVTACVLIATGLIYRGAIHLESENPAHVGAFFALGEGALLLFLLLYQWVTPYDVCDEITEKT